MNLLLLMFFCLNSTLCCRLALLICFPRCFVLRYTLLGELEFLMKSISSAVATQYPETLGEFTFDDIRAENLYQSWRFVGQSET